MICLAIVAMLLCPVLAVAAQEDTLQGYQGKAYQYVALGRYPQTEQGEEKPVLWRVLSANGKTALLLSEYVLDVRPASQKDYKSWADSELYQWLNDEFAERLLNESERAIVRQNIEQKLIDLPESDGMKKEDHGFKMNESRMAEATPYAVKQGAAKKSARYWTATLSTSRKMGQRCIAEDGTVQGIKADDQKTGIRPIIELNTALFSIAEGKGTKDAPYVLMPSGQALSPAAEAETPPATAEKAETGTEAAAEKGSSSFDGFPALTAEGFLPEGEKEFIFIDAENGVWRYASQTLRIEIKRNTIEKGPIRYLAAEIFVKDGEGGLKMYPFDREHMTTDAKKYLARPVDIAKQHQLVFAMDGDYFLYRIRATEVNRNAIGVEIRDGEIVVDRPPKKERTTYPPLDNMALFANGDMQVFPAMEKTAEEFLAMGAKDVLSFGPYLIKDGEINRGYKWYGTTKQPRAAVGMVEKGHYWGLIVEGRIKPSKGMDCMEVSELMKELGCTTAFNLDGGWTSAMIFMGKQLNQLDKSGVHDNARDQNEVMGIGVTDAY